MAGANGQAKAGRKKTGAPALYASAEKLQAKIDEYFERGVAKRKVIIGPANNRQVELIEVPTMSGLVIYLGFCSRQSFYDLEKRPVFSYTIKKARERICRVYEEQLHTAIPTGGIFALKNLGGWRDRDVDEMQRMTHPAPRFIFHIGTERREDDTAELLAAGNGRVNGHG